MQIPVQQPDRPLLRQLTCPVAAAFDNSGRHAPGYGRTTAKAHAGDLEEELGPLPQRRQPAWHRGGTLLPHI